MSKNVIPIIPLAKIKQVGIMGITSVGGVAMGQVYYVAYYIYPIS